MEGKKILGKKSIKKKSVQETWSCSGNKSSVLLNNGRGNNNFKNDHFFYPNEGIKEKFYFAHKQENIHTEYFYSELKKIKMKFCIKDGTMEPADFILKVYIRVHLHSFLLHS